MVETKGKTKEEIKEEIKKILIQKQMLNEENNKLQIKTETKTGDE